MSNIVLRLLLWLFFVEEPETDTDEYVTGSNEASNISLSDMDYLKKKVTSREESGKNEVVEEVEKTNTRKNVTTRTECKTTQVADGDDPRLEDFERKSEFTVKLRGLPFHVKKKDIMEFLSPLKIVDIRMTKDKKNRPSGRAYVDLESKEDLKDALSRHKDYIKGRYIEVFKDKKKRESEKDETDSEPPWMKNAMELAENKDLSVAEVWLSLL